MTDEELVATVAGQVSAGLLVGYQATSEESRAREVSSGAVQLAQAIIARVRAAGLVPAAQRLAVASEATGEQVAWRPLAAEADLFIAWQGSTDLVVHGFGLPSRVAQQVTVSHRGPSGAVLWVVDRSPLAPLGTGLQNVVPRARMPVCRGGWCTYVHDGLGWRMVGHEQGEWVRPGFDAADYTALPGLAWTVQPGDVLTDRYRVAGTEAIYQFDYYQTTVGGGAGSTLRRRLPPHLWPPEGLGISATPIRIQQAGGLVTHGAAYVSDFFHPGTLNLIDTVGGTLVGGTDNNRWQGRATWPLA